MRIPAGSLSILSAWLLVFTACVTATAITPSPLAPARQAELQAKLLGDCHVTSIQKVGGAPREAKGIHWSFSSDGKLRQHILAPPFADVRNEYTWILEGANVVTNSPFETLRVDDFSGSTLALFVYGTSETYFCTKD